MKNITLKIFLINILIYQNKIALFIKKPASVGPFAGTGKTESGEATLERTGTHELGHSGKLQGHDYPSGNVMLPSANSDAGMQMSLDQILFMKDSFDNGKLNNGIQKIPVND